MADLSDDELNAASHRIGQLLSAALTCDHPAMLDWARIAFALRERAAPSVGAEGLPPLPEPNRTEHRFHAGCDVYIPGDVIGLYTAEQVREAQRAALASRPAVDADKRDAERYRFLRDDFSPMGLNIDGNHAWAYRRNATLKGPTLDAAIDAARHPAQRENT